MLDGATRPRLRGRPWILAAIAALVVGRAGADGAAFDLDGPALVATVTRGNTTLPIDEVPSLDAGDRLSLRAELSPSQSVHYLMVLVFLRGATNPPPPQWFHPCETWQAPCRDQGIVASVPEGATQALVLLAPSTRGDFHTIVDAITGRPGAFVRASQALRQAALERSRLDAYIAELAQIDRTDRSRIKDSMPLLARSLGLKVDEHCADRSPEQQLTCLMQRQDTLVLNDGHSASVVDALTSGPSADLALVAASTPALGGGYYGPYVASLLNVGRIVSNMRTARYQYLPSLAMPAHDRLQLSLNSPPSFHEPMSVMVATLPTVTHAAPPPLRAADPGALYCARRRPLVLAVDGAPLAFSTHYVHDMQLRLSSGGQVIDIPAVADAGRGGYAVDGSGIAAEMLRGAVDARLHGSWGFEEYNGPGFRLVGSAGDWARSDSPDEDLVAGRDNDLRLRSSAADCVGSIAAEDASGAAIPVDWKPAGAGEIALKLHLQSAPPGPVTLRIAEFGPSQPVTMSMHAYPDAVRIDAVFASGGDGVAVVRGHRLDEVASLRIDQRDFTPVELLRRPTGDELTLQAGAAAGAAPMPVRSRALVRLRSGRTMQVPVGESPAPPVAALISRTVDHQPHGEAIPVMLAGDDDIAPDEVMRFALRLDAQDPFTSDMAVEVANADGRIVGRLMLDQGLQLQDAHTIIARFSPAALLGPDVFGALRCRVATQKLPGAWQDLVRVVRLPRLLALDCAHAAGTCRLSGRDLYMLASVGAGPGSGQAVAVPDGYTEDVLQVPAPARQSLFVSFRDDPASTHEVRLPSRRGAGATMAHEKGSGGKADDAAVASEARSPP